LKTNDAHEVKGQVATAMLVGGGDGGSEGRWWETASCNQISVGGLSQQKAAHSKAPTLGLQIRALRARGKI